MPRNILVNKTCKIFEDIDMLYKKKKTLKFTICKAIDGRPTNNLREQNTSEQEL